LLKENPRKDRGSPIHWSYYVAGKAVPWRKDRDVMKEIGIKTNNKYGNMDMSDRRFGTALGPM
jgi:hypothetical protein